MAIWAQPPNLILTNISGYMICSLLYSTQSFNNLFRELQVREVKLADNNCTSNNILEDTRDIISQSWTSKVHDVYKIKNVLLVLYRIYLF